MDAHPEPKIVYTTRLERAKIRRMLKFKSEYGNGRGRGVHKSMARIRAIVGARINRSCEDVEGRMGSLINNLIPSAIGWSRPNGPTILGPLRCCIYPRIFRSIRVRNATASRMGAI